MERNVIIAIVLSLAVLLAFQALNPPPKPVPQEAEAPAEVGNTPAAPAAPPAPATAQPETPEVPAAAPVEEKTVRVETELYTATLSSRGGTLERWELKKYLDDAHEKNVRLLDGPGRYRPLGLGVDDDFSYASLPFAVSGGDVTLDVGTPTGTVVFTYRGDDYSIRRTYTFHYDSYHVELEDEVSGLPEYQITLGTDFGMFDPEGGYYSHVGPVLLEGVEREEITAKKLKATRYYTKDVKWIGIEDKYFFSSIVPMTAMEKAKVWRHQDSAAISIIGAPGTHSFLLYAGPKVMDDLAELGVGLEHVVDFGFFSIIARPIFWLLKTLNGVMDNYGWSIVILTIIVRVPFIPIVNKGQRAMKKLQTVQPLMQEIKEKHKNDPKAQQAAMMNLYKKHKVNPMGGCLPLVLQLPVFFALYKVLLVAIELRNAPWVLWITDLSQKDPYYILPIVMGVSMVLQQKMTPTAGDPRQQKIMMLMPVVFTFLFLNFASGLVLYWLVNNLLAIAQQAYVNYSKPKSETA
jgi:YidC/Oxa1 family membrane protein insertase